MKQLNSDSVKQNLFIGMVIGMALQQGVIAYTVHKASKDIEKISSTVAFDIDLARKTFMQESEFLFMQGCLSGTKREATARPSSGYDTNSPQNYCTNKGKDWASYWDYHAFKLGRRD